MFNFIYGGVKMAKLFEGEIIPSYNKLYELDNYMFIGGLIHDKQSFVPHFNKWGGILSDNYKPLFITVDKTISINDNVYSFP